MVILVVNAYNNKKKNSNAIQEIPDFEFIDVVTLDTIKRKELDEKFDNHIFVYFNTQCDYCTYDIKAILKNTGVFRNSQVLLVSSEDTEIIRKAYDISDHPNFGLYHCNREHFELLFHSSVTPSFYIYNAKGVLTKSFIGETRLSLVDSVINSHQHNF